MKSSLRDIGMLILTALVAVFLAACDNGVGDNNAPVANAGSEQNVKTGSLVTLDGSTSSDADGDILTYNWSFTSKPDDSNATFSDSTVVNPTFTADVDGTYVINLVVNDGTVDSLPDTVTITTCTDGIFVQAIGAANGLSFDSNGDLYITDYKNGSLLKVSTPFQSGVNSHETILAGISNMVDIAFTNDDRLFIAGDTFNVYEVFSDGSYSLVADGFSYLTSIESYGNYLYISNSGDGTITKMDKNGNKETFLSGLSSPNGPYGISIDSDGNLYFIDHETGIIYKSDQEGNLTSLGNVSSYGGTYTGVDSESNIYVSDVNIGTLYVIDTNGQMAVFADGFSGKDNPPVNGPNDIAFDSSGNMYVADGLTVKKYCASQ